MERYLSEIAHEYERLGFPAPILDRTVERADGSKAYVIFYYDLVGQIADTFAVYSSGCAGERTRRLIHVNAVALTDAAGRVTDKGYGDLAHELFHAVFAATPFHRRNCEAPTWISEGLPEAIGHDMARQFRGAKSIDKQFMRWGLRPYSQRFATDGGADNDNDYRYQTSSFWRYLAELEHRRKRGQSKPGPKFDEPSYGTDYGIAARMLRSTDPAGDDKAAVEWLNRWLPDDSRIRQSFAKTYVDFIHAFAAYGRYRVHGKPYDETLQRWLGPCPDVSISKAQRSGNAKLSFGMITSRCLRLAVGEIGPPTQHRHPRDAAIGCVGCSPARGRGGR